MNRVIITLHKQTLEEALEGKASTMLVAIADISTVEEWAPVSDKLPDGMSIVTLKKGARFPIKGTPERIWSLIEKALES